MMGWKPFRRYVLFEQRPNISTTSTPSTGIKLGAGNHIFALLPRTLAIISCSVTEDGLQKFTIWVHGTINSEEVYITESNRLFLAIINNSVIAHVIHHCLAHGIEVNISDQNKVSLVYKT